MICSVNSKTLALLLAGAIVRSASAQDVTCCSICPTICSGFGVGVDGDDNADRPAVVAPVATCRDLGYFMYQDRDSGSCGMTGAPPNGDCFQNDDCTGSDVGPFGDRRRPLAYCEANGFLSLNDFYTGEEGICKTTAELRAAFPLPIDDGPPDGVGGIRMDPHVQKWNGEWYDYNGECDLVLLSVPELDMDIHVRTTIRYSYSFIQTAAVRIGTDVLEVASWGEYLLNGVEGALVTNNHGQAVPMLGDYPIDYVQMEAIKHRFIIPIDEHGHNITLMTYKDFVNVQIDAPAHTLVSSHGLMGDFQTGKSLARNGETVVSDPKAFGQEWQVLESEPNLFAVAREPQAPKQQCRLPEEAARGHNTNSVLHQAAVKECEEHARQNKDACVADVMATGDLGMVQGSGAF